MYHLFGQTSGLRTLLHYLDDILLRRLASDDLVIVHNGQGRTTKKQRALAQAIVVVREWGSVHAPLSRSGQVSDVRSYKDVVEYRNILAISTEAVDWHKMPRQHTRISSAG